MPVILALARQSQEDQEFKVRLDYIIEVICQKPKQEDRQMKEKNE
jgi:hypothetical protein